MLIERLEQATGASRELDAEIAEVVYPYLLDCQRYGEGWLSPQYGNIRCEAYTASLDAAISLVPHVEPRTHWHLQCYPHGCYSATVSDVYPVGTHYCGQHMTSPAIALCLACLRARP